jgi:hypothetical protein
MAKNYYLCSESDTVVVSWIVNEQNTSNLITGLSDVGFQVYNIVLSCSKEALIDRWKKDTVAEWRSDEKWLSQSISSLDDFNNRSGVYIIDTSDLSADKVADKIIEKMGD